MAAIPDNEIYELMSIKRAGEITLSAVMNFSPYPQAYFPQLCIIATVVSGTEMGAQGEQGERFLDNQRIEGNIPEFRQFAEPCKSTIYHNRNSWMKEVVL